MDNKDVLRLRQDMRLRSYEINDFNINQFLIVEDELNNCECCQGLAECKNIQRGYIHSPVASGDDYNFPLRPCQYKKRESEALNGKSHIRTMHISKASLEANLDDFRLNTEKRRKAYNYAVSFISTYTKSNFVKGINVYGGYGSGKTYFLSAVANELGRRGLDVLLIYFPDLARELKAMQFKPELEEIINELKMVDVLMLDDLGAETLNSFLRDDILGPVLNYRLQDGKAVFISTNLKPSELGEHFKQTKEEAYNNTADDTKAMRIMKRITGLMVNCDFGKVTE